MLHVIISPGWTLVTNEIWLWMQNRDCLGVLVALLIKGAPFELEMIKKGSWACGSGVSVWPGSGSQQRWHHVIIRDRFWAGVEFADSRGRCGVAISTFHLSSLVKYPQVCSELAVFCVAVLSSLFPGHTAADPFEPLRMLAESWKINALTLGREELGFGQFGPSCVNYSFVRRDSVTNAAAAEVH